MPMRHIDTVIIHCSATPNGRPYTIRHLDAWHAARRFRRDEKALKNWQPQYPYVGYHEVIHVDGTVISGRGWPEIGAHAAGFNTTSIGICMIGQDAFTLDQWGSLHGIVRQLTARFEIERIIGHRDVNMEKQCPGFDVAEWLKEMSALSAHLLSNPK